MFQLDYRVLNAESERKFKYVSVHTILSTEVENFNTQFKTELEAIIGKRNTSLRDKDAVDNSGKRIDAARLADYYCC